MKAFSLAFLVSGALLLSSCGGSSSSVSPEPSSSDPGLSAGGSSDSGAGGSEPGGSSATGTSEGGASGTDESSGTATTSSSAELPPGAIFEDFNASASLFEYGSGGHQAAFTHVSGAASPDEPGTTTLTLTLDTADAAGAWQGPNYQTSRLLGFGTYSARIKTASARGTEQPLAGAVAGFFTYRHDTDDNGNGVLENSEIDFEWLIADPRVIYLTAWVDVNDDPWRVTKINRTIDLSRGRILQTVWQNLDGTSGSFSDSLSNSPSTIAAIPDYDASARFYVYGFDWATDRIRWWMVDPASPADTVVLWDFRGDAKYITQQPAYLMLNFWHTADWSVEGVPNSTQKPRLPFATQFDWVRFVPKE